MGRTLVFKLRQAMHSGFSESEAGLAILGSVLSSYAQYEELYSYVATGSFSRIRWHEFDSISEGLEKLVKMKKPVTDLRKFIPGPLVEKAEDALNSSKDIFKLSTIFDVASYLKSTGETDHQIAQNLGNIAYQVISQTFSKKSKDSKVIYESYLSALRKNIAEKYNIVFS